MKLCLHSSYLVQNSFYFDEIFRKKKNQILPLKYYRHSLIAKIAQESNASKIDEIAMQAANAYDAAGEPDLAAKLL